MNNDRFRLEGSGTAKADARLMSSASDEDTSSKIGNRPQRHHGASIRVAPLSLWRRYSLTRQLRRFELIGKNIGRAGSSQKHAEKVERQRNLLTGVGQTSLR